MKNGQQRALDLLEALEEDGRMSMVDGCVSLLPLETHGRTQKRSQGDKLRYLTENLGRSFHFLTLLIFFTRKYIWIKLQLGSPNGLHDVAHLCPW